MKTESIVSQVIGSKQKSLETVLSCTQVKIEKQNQTKNNSKNLAKDKYGGVWLEKYDI